MLDSGLASDVDFEQDGVIYATTPALAMELSPRFSAGAALNFYHDDPFDGGGVHSLTTARYRGASDGNTRIADTRTTSGDYTYTGLSIRPPTGSSPLWRTNAIAPGAGEIPAFTDRTTSTAHTGTRVAGEYREENQFDGFTGINATLGALWNVNERLTLGGSVDLPWSADATQTKTLRSRSRTRDLRGRVIDEEDTTERASSDVTFDFPLRAALGMAVRWSDAFTTSLDAEYTRWSDFAFQAGDGPRINPLDGTAHGEHAIEDCWSVRAGAEYLLILRRTEIPFRVGVGREERPAIGRPDEIWQLSAGTGFAIGRGPGRTIVDLAYQYSRGRDVMGSLVPGREVTTDVDEHEGYLSCIRHF